MAKATCLGEGTPAPSPTRAVTDKKQAVELRLAHILVVATSRLLGLCIQEVCSADLLDQYVSNTRGCKARPSVLKREGYV